MRRASIGLVACSVVTLACKDIVNGIQEPPKETAPKVTKGVTKVDVVSGTLADGVSAATVTVTVDTVVRPTDNRVLLTTTIGTFLGGTSTITVPVDTAGFAFAELRAPNVESTGRVSATAANITQYASVAFAAAPPTRVQLTTTDFELKSGSASSVVLTAQLLRPTGTPSPGDTVVFSATSDSVAGPFGEFIPGTIVATSPTVTSRFSAGANAKPGRVTLRVDVRRGQLHLSDAVDLFVVK